MCENFCGLVNVVVCVIGKTDATKCCSFFLQDLVSSVIAKVKDNPLLKTR